METIPKTLRPWGYYRVLHESPSYKVKELVIEPGKSLSMQRHSKRAENWYILKGQCSMQTEYLNDVQTLTLTQNSSYNIGNGVWHQGQNNTDVFCHILEIQHGTECTEEDIERR